MSFVGSKVVNSGAILRSANPGVWAQSRSTFQADRSIKWILRKLLTWPVAGCASRARALLEPLPTMSVRKVDNILRLITCLKRVIRSVDQKASQWGAWTSDWSHQQKSRLSRAHDPNAHGVRNTRDTEDVKEMIEVTWDLEKKPARLKISENLQRKSPAPAPTKIRPDSPELQQA